MPDIAINGATLHYESTGEGAQTILFMHGLLWSGEMYGAQIAELSRRYRCVTFDFRGQGRSEVTAAGYDMDSLFADAVALIETLGLGVVHAVGLSMGGFVAMRLAARRPDLVRSLALLETSAEPESPDVIPRYRLLAFVGRWLGLRLVAGRIMPIMFGRTFLTDPARAAERSAWRERLLRNDRIGIERALDGVVERASVESELARIAAPTLVIVGDEDVATVPARAQRIRDGIAGARLVVIPGAGHSSTIEQPAAVTAALSAFLDGVAGSGVAAR